MYSARQGDGELRELAQEENERLAARVAELQLSCRA